MWNWDDHFDALASEKKGKPQSSLDECDTSSECIETTSHALGGEGRFVPSVPDVTEHPDWSVLEAWGVGSTPLWSAGSLLAYPALMRRRGSTLKTLLRDREAALLVAMSWCLESPHVTVVDADHYLETLGDWLAISRFDLWAMTVALGVMDKTGFVLVDSVREASQHALRQACEAFLAQEKVRQAQEKAWREAKNKTDNPKPICGSPVATPEDEYWMELALQEARKGGEANEIPVGALLVQDGRVLASAHNLTVARNAPMQHAECLVIQEATRALTGHGKLNQATLYVTLEPCPLCAGAIWEARVGRVVYGASDEKMGAMGGAFNLFDVKTLNHHPTIVAGVKKEASQTILKAFFKALRQSSKLSNPY